MTKKIFKSIFAVASAVLLACLLIVFGVQYKHFGDIEEDLLRTDMSMVRQGVEIGGIKYLEGLKDNETRITWLAEDGTVIYDNKAKASDMENHSQREEIREALKNGTGDSQRYSTTRMEKTIYYAKALEDGTVLRLSRSRDSVLALAIGMIQPLFFILILAVIASGIIAAGLSRRIVEPLNRIVLDEPMENRVYDELAPLLRTIDRQHRQIDSQFAEQEQRRSEFNAVVENMTEGLLLLGRDSKVISINKAACRFFDASEECAGADFITIERSKDFEEAIDTAASRGSCEFQLCRGGREYQVNISRIADGGDTAGMVILVFDISDKALAERNRREFTANVSHELKTPLQAIMGRAELIEQGLVKSEDMPQFIANIRLESARLLTLIEDIIYLSQLDEHAELAREETDLYREAAREIEALQPLAEKKNISMSLSGSTTAVNTVPQLIHEVLYNLCDNAIKYNFEGGRVDVSVGGDGKQAWVLVEDTGIGIAGEDLDRIFERFYRVDKSRSKETGGTGLGLSIVKHAVDYMKGNIEIESAENKGTAVKIIIPVF